MADAIKTDSGEWANGWPIVLASVIGVTLCLSPVPYWALIVNGPELAKEFGWSRATISAGFLFMTAGVLVGAPIVGRLVDRYGSRRILLPSIFALSLGTCAFSLMTDNPVVFYSIFFMTAFFGTATLPITWSKAIVNNFDRFRGLALGIALTGTGLFGFIATPIIQGIGVGLLPVLISFPLAYFLFHDEKEKRALAQLDGSNLPALKSWIWQPLLFAAVFFAAMIFVISNYGPYWIVMLMGVVLVGYIIYSYIASGKDTTTSALPGLTFRETFKDYRFWVILLAILLLGAVISGIIANAKFMLLDKGYTDQEATSRFIGAGVIALSVIVGRLVGGFLVDHIWAPLVAFIFLSVPAIGCYILMQDMSMGMNVMAMILIGFAAGVEFDLIAYFISRYFGTRSYGQIYGLIYAAFGLGSGTSPVVYNLIRGDDPDYSRVLSYAAVGFIVGATMCLFLGKYRNFEPEGH
jgi:MFS family permease